LINYQTNLSGITPSMLDGFFAGWGKIHPSTDKHFTILQNSTHIVLAIDDEINKVVGFVNAVSDKILSAYIPLLEVLPEYKIKGIGIVLMKTLLEQLEDFYMIDVTCDERHVIGYEKFGFKKTTSLGTGSMMIRNFDKRGGI
jgi:GNAT superfamily N-acetyltransferase